MKTRLFELMTQKQESERRILSAAMVAREAGVSRTTVHSWLKGDFTRLDESAIKKFCKYFDCELPDLLYIDWSAPDPNGGK